MAMRDAASMRATRLQVAQALRAAGGWVKSRALCDACGLTAGQVKRAMHALVGSGHAVREGYRYRWAAQDAADGWMEAVWRSIRMLGRFDVEALMATFGGMDTPPSRAFVCDYVDILNRAGYVHRSREGFALVLSRYKGPLAPSVRVCVCVYDANADKTTWQGMDGVAIDMAIRLGGAL